MPIHLMRSIVKSGVCRHYPPSAAAMAKLRAFAAGLLRHMRVAGGDAIGSGMKHQRLAVEAAITLDFADHDDVIAALVLANVAALEAGDAALDDRHAAEALATIHAIEFVGLRSRELPRQVVLTGSEDVDGEMRGARKVREARS